MINWQSTSKPLILPGELVPTNSESSPHVRKKHAIRDARRNAVDYHAGGVPKDHWHPQFKTKVVCQRPVGCFGIFFHTSGSDITESTLGVAMTECEYGGKGSLELRHSQMRGLLPKEVSCEFKGAEATVIISWPGYFHLKYKKSLYMDTALGDVASQIACIFREFYNKHHQDFRGPGIRLGPSYMTFDRLRLRSIFWDGRMWNIETAYVYEDTMPWDLV